MPEFPKLPIVEPPRSFPPLPIVTPDPPPGRKSLSEKYGALYYLGLVGLAVTLLVVGTFAYGVWSARSVFVALYALNDPRRPEPERIRAAWHVAHDPASNDQVRYEQGILKTLPDLARYVLIESLTSDAIQSDTKAYALKVARSEGWPGWFRLLMIRPMAYGSGEGYRIPWEPLDELRRNPDRATVLWATYARAVMGLGDEAAVKELSDAAQAEGPSRELAALLDAAVNLQGDARTRKLDEATRWLRTHHPLARELWRGWEVRDGELVQIPAM